jgi:hypothetical protein
VAKICNHFESLAWSRLSRITGYKPCQYATCSTQVSSGCIIWPKRESVKSVFTGYFTRKIDYRIIAGYKIEYFSNAFL